MPPTRPKSNHEDTKSSFNLFQTDWKLVPGIVKFSGNLKPNNPKTRELLGVLGDLVVNRMCECLGALTRFRRLPAPLRVG